MDELESQGHSKPWQGQKASVEKIFDEMRLSSPELRQQFPVPFAELPAEIILERKVYARTVAVLGASHEDTILTGNNFILSLQRCGLFGEAQSRAQRWRTA